MTFLFDFFLVFDQNLAMKGDCDQVFEMFFKKIHHLYLMLKCWHECPIKKLKN